MIKCIIFDCDGTLVNSEYLCNLALEIKLKEYGVESSANEMMQRFRGGKLANILETLENDHQIKLGEDFVPLYRSLVENLFEQKLKPCEGVSEMLQEIALPKCVASSGPIEKINKALSLTGLTEHFIGNIYSSYIVGSWKPDPGIFLHAARDMGFRPDECAVVEDSPLGITAAQSAGMYPVLYDPIGTHKTIEGAHRIEHMEQLKDAIT
ncbi:HAD superfamily hydrolase (TIGR01509 family) [Sinobacterium caligoides]|uniref:HAD superfamily hydrolase (TIGR01509 family) n=1 Tax=Sinobacterium caligoides TaxID=933926 RepID=A0A3N2E098_9GAMM|nr:HAD-IA family hydrolase [Sinobacterium caligoides]ROS05531.1 HAD superfamily hydrolase (TIGR01509 family) [Sinobacterium caligoides]